MQERDIQAGLSLRRGRSISRGGPRLTQARGLWWCEEQASVGIESGRLCVIYLHLRCGVLVRNHQYSRAVFSSQTRIPPEKFPTLCLLSRCFVKPSLESDATTGESDEEEQCRCQPSRFRSLAQAQLDGLKVLPKNVQNGLIGSLHFHVCRHFVG